MPTETWSAPFGVSRGNVIDVSGGGLRREPAGRKAQAATLLGLSVVAFLVLLAPQASAAEVTITFAGSSTRVETLLDADRTYLRLADVTGAVSGVRHRNPATGKATLVVGESRISMTTGSPFAALDGSVENMAQPLLYRRGDLWVPQGFLSRVLSRALNASIEWDPTEGLISIVRLGPVVSAVSLEDLESGETVVTFDLSRPTEFAAESVHRESVEVFIAGATLVDSLPVPIGSGQVSAVAVEAAERGVRAVITVAPAAGSYRAELLANPPRVEISIGVAPVSRSPSPALRSVRRLRPDRGVVPDRQRQGIETVMIDPGRGGSAAGPLGSSGISAKDVTLALARALSNALQREGFYVFLTRSSDSSVPPKRRAEMANLTEADLFLSLDCDAWNSGWARGFRVSYYEPPTTIRREGGRDRGTGLPRDYGIEEADAADDLLWTRTQEDFLAESRVLARSVHASMAGDLPLADRGIGRRTLAVLSGCAMPAIRVEVGYISNADDEALLTDERFLREAARAIARGVVAYRSTAEGRVQ